MVTVDEVGRPEPPLAAGELEAVLGFLEFQRATLEWKTRGLGTTGLRSSLPPSTMTLAGLLKHLAFVEDYWFGYRLLGAEPAEEWRSADWSADPDWDWTSAAHDDPDRIRALWHDAVVRSRAAVDTVLETGDLGAPAARPGRDGAAPNLRWVLLHMVEEYARHNGHADLLREAVDGQTGE